MVAIGLAVATASCNKNEVITAQKPAITLDNPDGIYTVKTGQPLTITPAYTNATDASYAWVCNGELLASTPELTYTWQQAGTYYIDLTVRTDAGAAAEEMRVEVVDLAIPLISLPVDPDGITLALGGEFCFRPEIANSEGTDLAVEWTVNGQTAATGREFTFHADAVGEYTVEVTATNTDGSDSKKATVRVVEQLPFVITFPTPSPLQQSTTRYTFPGRTVCLKPEISGTDPISYAWSVNGTPVEGNSATFRFTPDAPGEYLVNLTVNGMATAGVKVVCVDADEQSRFRKPTAASRPDATKVFEWMPAPGQFINETRTGGMTGAETTLDAAVTWAQSRLASKQFVSLGAWGGYIIVGFDHSVACNNGDFAFAVSGNATGTDFATQGLTAFNAPGGNGTSNEPGIIYVSQDVNGNGLPDDEWYELRGSETGKASTWQDYAVTYFRPGAPQTAVQWTDNRGQTGSVDYLKNFHSQDYYYPAWVSADAYTLRGTRLEARTSQNPETGMWSAAPFEWGYADNLGTDAIDGAGQQNGFVIENAIYPDLTPVELKYIDFVKIQTGVNSKAGWLGEISTEVLHVTDLSVSQSKAASRSNAASQAARKRARHQTARK